MAALLLSGLISAQDFPAEQEKIYINAILTVYKFQLFPLRTIPDSFSLEIVI